MTDARVSATTAEAARLQRLEERVASIEAILFWVPLVLAELALVVSLFVPFISTEVDGADLSASLFSLPFQLFGSGESGDIPFGIAFLVLLLVAIGSIIAIAATGRGGLSPRAAGAVTVFPVLLVLGTAGAWFVIAIGMSSDDPWVPEPGVYLLTAGALLAALVALLPAYRKLWAE